MSDDPSLRLPIFLKVAATLSLIVLFAIFIDFDQVLTELLGLKKKWVLAATAIWLINQVLVTWRWAVLLDPLGYRIPFRFLFRSTMVGHFANYYTPGEWAIEASWIFTLVSWTGDKLKPVLSVMMDKLLALISTVALGLISLLISSYLGLLDGGLISDFELENVISLSLIVIFSAFFLFKVREKFSFFRNRARKFIASSLDDIKIYRSHIGCVLLSLLIGFMSRIIMVFFIWMLSKAIGMNIPVLIFFSIVPFILLASSVPLSIYNIGVKEGLYVFFLTQFGVSSEQAVALGLLVSGWALISGLLSSVALLTPTGVPSREEQA